jgi:hypothetical protein
MLERLLDMARDTSSGSRRELFRTVSDLFVDGAERYTDREIALFGEVIARLAKGSAVGDRIKLAERVAGLGQTPHELALRLADDDEHRVATPVLEQSAALTSDDLVELASRRDDDYRLAIARRSDLSEAVTDALVDNGDREVLQAVTRNRGARFSGRGMTALAEKALADQRLAESLCERTDLPPPVVEMIVKVVSPAALRNLAHLLREGHPALAALADDGEPAAPTARQTAIQGRAEAQQMALDVRRKKRKLDEIISELARQGRHADLAYVLADIVDVAESHVLGAIEKPSATEIAVVCRMLDVSVQAYADLTAMRLQRLSLGKPQGQEMMREYGEMSRATAERALKFHQARNVGRKR